MKHIKDIAGILIMFLLVIGIIWIGAKSSESPPETTPEETKKSIVSVEVDINTGLFITKKEDIEAIIEIFKAHDTYEPRESAGLVSMGNTYVSFIYSNGEEITVNMYNNCATVTGKGVYAVGPDLVSNILDYIWTTEEYKEFAKEKGWDIEETTNENDLSETDELTEATASSDYVHGESSSNDDGNSNTETSVNNEKETEEETTKQPSSSDDTDVSTPSGMTTMQVVKDMGIGINLGNTFESCGDWINGSSVTNYETAWGSPVITEAMIKGMAAEGFKTIRIPVAWSNMMDENYNIDPAYINRVKEVATWAIDNDMYVIINIHWDGGWWTNFPTDKDNCTKKYKAIWNQLSASFADVGEKLVFESLNEEGVWDSVWNRYGGTTGKTEAYNLLNEINQTFVDVVRASGGNNATRHLLIAGYATDITLTCDSCFKMPNDPQNRCAVSVHYYTPFGYTHLEKDESWAQVQTEWGSDADIAELNKYMKMMYDNFVSKGIPVIIGEFGVPMVSNKEPENVVLYISTVAQTAYDYGMCPVLWDTTNNQSYYDRYTCSMSNFPSLKEALLKIVR